MTNANAKPTRNLANRQKSHSRFNSNVNIQYHQIEEVVVVIPKSFRVKLMTIHLKEMSELLARSDDIEALNCCLMPSAGATSQSNAR
ncbi:hypothetical protein AC578_5982 [Pseudocercospora eumusae]|uniref:Uncharacterized protein n=1 Tax=Pseudocercospora eumusae TaxID=321146 RepID=A0A139HID0_9PEZI|nr:hypothetical protein AC578_5982 [Pseudocercospora eumusae]